MQLTFGDAEGLGQRKRTRKEIFLAEMEQVVPAAYTLVDDLEERVLGKLRRKAADASEVAAPP
ncbi:MAG: hypothetical protein A2882_07650 [Phenylobacterium sp. RIFCSPHIGHO2_01_FULL_70_10]|nr:MAG: hypothetical protein A2882_07650 [Phenylobacterium sp. RIFCSPHIGHO2_01_FULL_70_10]